MIKVVKKENSIMIKGHAKFAEYGQDIVCAAVSSIVTTTINGILKIDQNSIIYKQDENQIEIKILKSKKNTNLLIENMLDLLAQLAKKYPNNLEMK